MGSIRAFGLGHASRVAVVALRVYRKWLPDCSWMSSRHSNWHRYVVCPLKCCTRVAKRVGSLRSKRTRAAWCSGMTDIGVFLVITLSWGLPQLWMCSGYDRTLVCAKNNCKTYHKMRCPCGGSCIPPVEQDGTKPVTEPSRVIKKQLGDSPLPPPGEPGDGKQLGDQRPPAREPGHEEWREAAGTGVWEEMAQPPVREPGNKKQLGRRAPRAPGDKSADWLAMAQNRRRAQNP